MAYYYIVEQTLEDGTEALSITKKETYDEADSQMSYDNFYNKSTSNVAGEKLAILDNVMNCVDKKIWNRPIVVDEEE